MKFSHILIATLAASFLDSEVRGDEDKSKKETEKTRRVTRQTSADQMVQNILQWIQGAYSQQSRRIRQGTFREYLPPTYTQKPRPFEPSPDGNGFIQNDYYIPEGYPPAGITPQPPFPLYTKPTPGPVTAPTIEPIGPTGPGYPPAGYPSPSPLIPTQPPPVEFTGYPSERPAEPTPATTTQFPTEKPIDTTGYPSEKPGPFTQSPLEVSTGYPEKSTSTQPPSELTSEEPEAFTGYPPQQPETSSPSSLTTQRPELPSESSSPETEGPTQAPFTNVPVTLPTTLPSETLTTTSESQPPASLPTTQSAEINTIPTEGPERPTEGPERPTEGPERPTEGPERPTEAIEAEDDLKHPPHIHDIEVECAKDMMSIDIEFNREFDGVIYSKGYYNMPECRYVTENSKRAKYSFTVNLNMCGTEFINAFDTQGQSYLENVLVMQNEVGIQEVWDTVRAVRCLWEGNLKESLSVALSVGMLTQEIVTFSGDTAMAKLDILLGKGPFGKPADGLVKIGEPMTLAVSVSGDPGFDVQVKDCKATDSTASNTVALTDENGCVLKPKLFGAFQKTRSTGNTGASIIAYAYFNAFKFPDVIDLMIECNIELCKTDCGVCLNPDQKIEPGSRRKRDLYAFNNTLHDGVTMGKHLRIIFPEDLNEKTIIDLGKNDGVCMSTQSFVFSSSLLISLLAASCLFSAYMWLKAQRLYLSKQ